MNPPSPSHETAGPLALHRNNPSSIPIPPASATITILKKFEVKKQGKKRRFTIELHRIPLEDQDDFNVLTIPSPRSATESPCVAVAESTNGKYHDNFFLRIEKHPSLMKKMLKPTKKTHENHDDNASLVSAAVSYAPSTVVGSESVAPSTSMSMTNTSNKHGWVSRYLLGLRLVDIQQVSDKCVTMKIRQTPYVPPEEHEFMFHDSVQAADFVSAIQHHKTQQMDREREQIKSLFQTIQIDLRQEMVSNNRYLPIGVNDEERMNAFLNQPLTFLIEIVGCQDLKPADITSSDPYVIARYQGQIIHKTKYCSKSLNPVFTLRKNAFFLWNISVRDLFLGEQDLQQCDESNSGMNFGASGNASNASNSPGRALRSTLLRAIPKIRPMAETKFAEGLTLEVKDFDAVGTHTSLGTAVVPPREILKGNEERLEYPLILKDSAIPIMKGLRSVRKKKSQYQAKIAIRIRRATDHDKEFLATYEQSEKKKKTNLLSLGGAGATKKKKLERGDQGVSTMRSITETKVRTFVEHGTKIQKFKVLPYPDPQRSEDDLIDTSKWMTASEVEESVMQPSRQFKSVGSGKIAKVYLEILACDKLPNMDGGGGLGNKTDAFVQVVYEDCVCQTPVIDDKNNPRFFPWTKRAFLLHSTYPSSVVNLGVFDHDSGAALKGHDFIGRAVVSLTDLRPGTEYLMDYKLYDSGLLGSRKDFGTIKIRVRVEVDDPRSYVLAGLQLPPPTYVNCRNSTQFQCVTRTCYGKDDMKEYSLNVIYELMDELWVHGNIYYYVMEEIYSLFLWRGAHKVMIRGEKVSLPTNSIVAFIMAITLVENPFLLPSYSFLTLAWILINSLRWRTDHPNPWYRCHSLVDFSKMVFLGSKYALQPESISENEGAEEAKRFDNSWEELIKTAEKKAAARAVEVAREQVELTKGLETVGGAGVDIQSEKSSKGLIAMPIPGLKKYLFPIQKMLYATCKWLRFAKNVFLWEDSMYSFWLTFLSLALSIILFFIPWFWIIKWTSRIVIWGLFGPWMKLVDIYVLNNGGDDGDIADENDRLARKQYNEKTLKQTRIKNELAFKLRDFKQYLFGEFLTKVHLINFDRFIETPLATSTAKPCSSPPPNMGIIDDDDKDPGQQVVGFMIPTVQETATTLVATARPEDTISPRNKDLPDPLVSMKVGGVICIIAVITHYTVPILISCAQLSAKFLLELVVR